MTQSLQRNLADLASLIDRAGSIVRDVESWVPANGNEARATLRQLIKWRRLRDQFFKPQLFGEPAWDILLELTLARLTEKRMSVTDACVAAAVPATTGLRWVNLLCASGLVERYSDARDRRRVYVALTESGWQAMSAYMQRAGIELWGKP